MPIHQAATAVGGWWWVNCGLRPWRLGARLTLRPGTTHTHGCAVCMHGLGSAAGRHRHASATAVYARRRRMTGGRAAMASLQARRLAVMDKLHVSALTSLLVALLLLHALAWSPRAATAAQLAPGGGGETIPADRMHAAAAEAAPRQPSLCMSDYCSLGRMGPAVTGDIADCE